MQDCVKCKTQIIPTNCIRTEEELSFEYESFNDILQKFDQATLSLKKILEAEVDKKAWLKTDHDNITEYIQDLINEVDNIKTTLAKNPTFGETKFKIASRLVNGEKTALQLFELIFKELENNKNGSSSSYLPY